MTQQTTFEDAENVQKRITRMQQALAGAGFAINTQAAAQLLGKDIASETFADTPKNLNTHQVARLAQLLEHYHSHRLREPGTWFHVNDYDTPPDPGKKVPLHQPVPDHTQPSDLAPLMVTTQHVGYHTGMAHLSKMSLNPSNSDPSLNNEWRMMRVVCDNTTGIIALCRDVRRSRTREEWPDSVSHYIAEDTMFEIALIEENYKRRAVIRPRFGDCIVGPIGEVSLWRRATPPDERAAENDSEEILRGFEYGVLLMATATGQDPEPFQRAIRASSTPTRIDRYRWVSQEAFSLQSAMRHMNRSPFTTDTNVEFYCPFTKQVSTGNIMRLPQRWQRNLLRWNPRQRAIIVDGNHSQRTKYGNWHLQANAGKGVRELRGNAILIDHDRLLNQHYAAFGPRVPEKVRRAILENPGQILMFQNDDGTMTMQGKPDSTLPPLAERTHTVQEITDFELHVGVANVQQRQTISY